MKLKRIDQKQNPKSWEIFSPLDQSSLGIYEKNDPEEVKKEIAESRQAFLKWSALSLEERLSFVKKARQAFYDSIDELIKIVHQETGKVTPEIYGGEIVANLELFDFYLKNAKKIIQDEAVSINPLNYPGKKGFIQHRPLGIVGVLSSWNYPVALPLRAIIPALVAGNCVAFKPSVDATLIGQKIAEIFETTLPPHVFVTAYGGREVNGAIVEEADKVNFIGSVGVGRHIATRCAERFIPCSTELSGKDAAIVLADCDLDRTVNGVIWGAFTNTGQNCASIERLFVEEAIYDRFVPLLASRIKQLQLKKEIGPLRNEKQLKLVESHVQIAKDSGCSILTGGKQVGDSLYYEPTLIEANDINAEFIREETFGPTLPVFKIKNIDEGIRFANDCQFGLTVSIWTKDLEAAKKLAPRLEAGVVMINNSVFTGALASAPWGGVKNTGHGVTNSKYGLLEMTRPHFVLIDKASKSKEAWWYPYPEELSKLMKQVVRSLGGHLSSYLRIPSLLKKVLKTRFDS